MQSRVRIAGHPLHPMLVVFPVALLPLLLLLDVLSFAIHDATYWNVGLAVGIAGVVTTLAAAVPGLVDLAAIPNETKAHRTAVYHLVTGVLILLVFVATVALRWLGLVGQVGVTVVDVVGVLLVTLQGWLGGELVYKHHIAVLAREEGGEPTPLETGDRDSRAMRRPGPGEPRL